MPSWTQYLRRAFFEDADPDELTDILRLANAVNDITFANVAMGAAMRESLPIEGSMHDAAARYFARIQLGHLYEATKVINDCAQAQWYQDLAAQCHPETRQGLTELGDIARKSGQAWIDFKRHVVTVRDKTTAHYDRGLYKSVVARLRQNRNHRLNLSMTASNDFRKRHFGFAETALAVGVVRSLWNVPTGDQTQASIESVEEYAGAITRKFTSCASELVARYAIRYRA